MADTTIYEYETIHKMYFNISKKKTSEQLNNLILVSFEHITLNRLTLIIFQFHLYSEFVT